MNKIKSKQYFTVPLNLILIDEKIPYEIFINSSGHELNDHFVKIYKIDSVLSKSDVFNIKRKYFQIYLLEDQRAIYLKSLVKDKNIAPEKKSQILKDTAIDYLDTLFNIEKDFTTDVLKSSIQGCQNSVEGMVDLLKDCDVQEVQNLIGKMSFHDFYTFDHSVNVSMYTITLCQAAKPKATKVELMEAGLGGMLHDLGKIKISTSIINNPGKLSDDDFNEIRKHPKYGIDLLENNEIDFGEGIRFEIIKRVIYEHHENYNGTGYPNGLKGDQIHPYARMTAICDFFDAITTKRSYHEVLSTEDAIGVMARSCGKKIDEKLFNIFVKHIGNLVYKTKANKEIGDDFDPCMPHDKLPIELAKADIKLKNFLKKDEDLSFGKVINSNKNKK